jgi:ElaA protein
MNIDWQFLTFDELSTNELYRVMGLRQNVFVVEQNCAYLDCDNKDQDSHHFLGRVKNSSSTELVAYLRILKPKSPTEAPHIGRVVCRKDVRQSGVGKELVQRGIAHCATLFPGKSIKISAQQYLVNFYTNLGFRISSTPYDEDGIPHVGMIYKPPSQTHLAHTKS